MRILTEHRGPAPLLTVGGFVSLDADQQVVLRDVHTGEVTRTLSVSEPIRIAVSFDRRLLAVGKMKGEVQLFDIEHGTHMWTTTIGESEGWVTALAFSAAADTLAVGTKNIAIVDTASGQVRSRRELTHWRMSTAVTDLVFAPHAGGAGTLWGVVGTHFRHFSLPDLTDSLDVDLDNASMLAPLDATRCFALVVGGAGVLDATSGAVLPPVLAAGDYTGASRLAVEGDRCAVLLSGPAGLELQLGTLSPTPVETARVALPGAAEQANALGGLSFGDGAVLVASTAGWRGSNCANNGAWSHVTRADRDDACALHTSRQATDSAALTSTPHIFE
jgi:hypothetical protein